MSTFFARLLYLLVAGLGRLPWAWLMWLGDAIAWLWRQLDAREARVARRNLELAYPALPQDERTRLHCAILRTSARQALETLRLWTRTHADNLTLIGEIHGIELFHAARARGAGVIIAAPHYGNWELLNQWLAAHTALAILYRPPESAIGEAFLQQVRADGDGQVTQIRAQGPAVRQLFKLLQSGGVVGILPDQQPKAGDGVFAPFFGLPALTMTLLSRLAGRTGATVLFAYCERLARPGATPNVASSGFASPSATPPALGVPAFALHFEAAPAQIAATDNVIAAQALNTIVERIARRDPAQYQWTYKRYTLRPSGKGQDNPYRDLERH